MTGYAMVTTRQRADLGGGELHRLSSSSERAVRPPQLT